MHRSAPRTILQTRCLVLACLLLRATTAQTLDDILDGVGADSGADDGARPASPQTGSFATTAQQPVLGNILNGVGADGGADGGVAAPASPRGRQKCRYNFAAAAPHQSVPPDGKARCTLLALAGCGISFNCEGGPVQAAFDETALTLLTRPSRYPGASFNHSGVDLAPECSTPGCLLTICGDTNVTIHGAVYKLEPMPGHVHSVLCVANTSMVTVQHAMMVGNSFPSAMRGVFGMHYARIVLDNTTITGHALLGNEDHPYDDNGAGVRVTDHAEVVVSGGSVIAGNLAPGGSGAGVFAGADAVVRIVDSTISNNTCDTFGGGVAAVANTTLAIGGRSVIAGNTARDGGGVAVLGNAKVQISREVVFGRNGITDSKRFGFDLYGYSTQPVQLPETCGYSNAAMAAVGRQAAPSALQCITKCDARVSLDRGACGAGMSYDAIKKACVCCPQWSYSFEVSYIPANDSNRVIECKKCPDNAMCPGADVVIPLPGYARSSQGSDQVHRCPLGAASCAGADECQSGYTGLLCTRCTPQYGTTAACKCGRCMDNPRLQFALYTVLVLVLVGFVVVTVFLSRRDAERAAAAAPGAAATATAASSSSAAPLPSRSNMSIGPQAAASSAQQYTRKVLEPSDAVKVLVQFLQYLVIIGGVAVPWPWLLVGMFQAASVVFGASGQAVSLDCWLEHYFKSSVSLPLAIQRQLVPFIGAVAVWLVVLVVQLLWGVGAGMAKCCSSGCFRHGRRGVTQPQQRRGRSVGAGSRFMQPLKRVWDMLPLTSLVCLFYAYPSLLRAALGFFACLSVDVINSSSATVTVPLMAHPRGYFVGDTRALCFEGWHRVWALGLGLPAVLLLCVGVPGGLFWVLKANKSRAAGFSFRRHFGFLYCSFRVPGRVWWEAVWSVQTVAMSAVAVFHFQLQAYYSMLLLALTLCISIAMQQVFKPYAVHQLHVIHSSASVCLLLTVFGGLAMFSVDKSAESLLPVHVAVGVLVLVMDVLMVGWCVYAIVSTGVSRACGVCIKKDGVLGKAPYPGSQLGLPVESRVPLGSGPSHVSDSKHPRPSLFSKFRCAVWVDYLCGLCCKEDTVLDDTAGNLGSNLGLPEPPAESHALGGGPSQVATASKYP